MWWAHRSCEWRNFILAGLSGIALAAVAQTSPQPGSRLPPTQPTSMLSQSSMAPPMAANPNRVDTLERHRARVSYENGLLQVRADNSSLNQILRDISRQTGMQIVGGVADQRVFGSYGPAPAATVLQTLLDGTGTNMLLKETADHAPEQLILSSRTGGVTPPGPSSASYDETETEPELPLPGSVQPTPVPATDRVMQGAVSSPRPTAAPPNPGQMQKELLGNVLGNPNNVSPTASTLPTTNSVPLSSLPSPSTAQPVSGIVSAPNPPPAGSTTAGFLNQTPPSPNPAPTANQAPATGVKTPQRIYEELKKLQQQNGNPQGSSAPQ